MKKFCIFLCLVLLSSIFSFIKATNSLTFSSGGNAYARPGFSISDYTGTLALDNTGSYYYTLERSGDFTTQNLIFAYNGYGVWYNWYEGKLNPMQCNTTGSLAILGGTIPGTATCGQQETIVIHVKYFYNDSEMCSYTYHIRVPDASVTSPTQICHGTSGTVTVTYPIAIQGTLTYTSSNHDWLFPNGNWSYSTTSSSVNIAAPSASGSSTQITVNGGNLCRSVSSASIKDVDVPAQPGAASYVQFGTCCCFNAKVTTVTDASSYLWKDNFNTTWTETTYPHTDGGDYQPNTTFTIYVKSKNVCGNSSQSTTTKKTPAPPPGCMNFLDVSNIDPPIGIEIYPNPNQGILNLKFELNEMDFNISIYNLSGQIIYFEKSRSIKGAKSIDLTKEAKGMYFIKVQTDTKIFIQKFIID